MDAIRQFQNGQVYSVLTKDEDGNFSTLSKKKDYSFAERVANQIVEGPQTQEKKDSGYLIHIVT